MSPFINQILSLLTTLPGNLIYHIVVVFSIAGTLLGAIRLLSSSQFPQARRTVFGLCVLLGLQGFLFIVSSLTFPGWLDPATVLPPLDRVVTLLGLTWITWLWVFPEPVRLADYATVLLNILGVALFGLTLMLQVQDLGAGFNGSSFDGIWQGFSLAVVLLGLLGLIKRKPNSWGNGLAILFLALIGHLLSLIWPMDGDFPGFVRLTQLAMFPILLTIVQRFPTSTALPVSVSLSGSPSEEPSSERRRYSADPKTLHALMSMAAEISTDKIGQGLTRSIAQAMLADMCFLLILSEDNSLYITCGYDLIREENLEGTAVNKDTIPLLATSIQRGRPLRLPASSTSSDLKGLGQILGLSNPGHLLSVPITSVERGPLGALLLLSSYSNRIWSAGDQAFLLDVSTQFLPILERGQRASLLEIEHDKASQDAQLAQEQAAELSKKYEAAAIELEQLHDKVSQLQLQVENLAILQVQLEESQKTIESLRTQIGEMPRTDAVVGIPGDSAQLERELRQALEQLARMQNAQVDANNKILELEKDSNPSITNEQLEVITSISQELRQPMSSIVGYTDLLLGESVGILGATQRKFIDRIKASTERMGGLLDDLIQITNLETGRKQFKAESIDLNLIIDNAMAYTGTQIREKNITLRLDIPSTSPGVQTDRDALQQIFIHLLQNATASTRDEGNITLRVQMQSESDKHFISIQVTDTGGGIASEDIPRVFSRRYRAEHSHIPGLGDTGVGLTIAKALAEAQGGRIWVETEAGNGSTFSILLPVLLEVDQVK
jgi:signal transduction histidine kinase